MTSPPLRYPCVYGIDMMTRGEFVAREHSVAQIARTIGADKLVYQSYEGLISLGAGRKARPPVLHGLFQRRLPDSGVC